MRPQATSVVCHITNTEMEGVGTDDGGGDRKRERERDGWKKDLSG